MNLTCEQLEIIKEQEDNYQLKPFRQPASLFEKFSDEQIARAVDWFHWRIDCTPINLLDKMTFELKANRVINYMKIKADLSFISDDEVISKIAKKIKAKRMYCYSNAFKMAGELGKMGIDAYMLSGLVTLPVVDVWGLNNRRVTFTHSVLQIGDYIYDYNYDIKLKANYYFKLFAFDLVDKIDSYECFKQLVWLKQHKIVDRKLIKYNGTFYRAFANRDMMKRLYDYSGRALEMEND